MMGSASSALKQLRAWRTGQRLPSVISRFKHGWVFLGVVSWLVAMYAGSHPQLHWQPPHFPLSVQAAGACCLVFAVVSPFFRIAQLTRRALDTYPHAIGSALLTGSPFVAILVTGWLVVTGRTVWQTLQVDHAEAATTFLLPGQCAWEKVNG